MRSVAALIVVVLLAVFAVFIAVTLVDIDPNLLAFSGYPPVSDIIASVALTFFAYLGFSVDLMAALGGGWDSMTTATKAASR